MAQIKPDIETFARIKVIGIGGGGGNAVSRMAEAKIRGIDFLALNTDAQDLHQTTAGEKIHIGKNVTKGLGAGMNPELGRQAAEESRSEIQDSLRGADMVFITCGMGGGTGTGGSSVVADIARDLGAITIAIVTKPFTFEGKQRMSIADNGMADLKDKVDTMITIPNDRVLSIIDRKTSMISAFETIDNILKQAVQGISDLITYPGLVNVDFADVKAIMQDSGPALIGIGVATGEQRAKDAATQAINSPLLEVAIDGARGVLFNISGGADLGMMEINEAAHVITDAINSDAKIIFGATHDPRLKKGEVKVTVIATGFDENGRKKDIQKSIFEKQNGSNEAVNSQKQAGENKKPSFIPDVSMIEEDEWEIPAFIRKKSGK